MAIEKLSDKFDCFVLKLVLCQQGRFSKIRSQICCTTYSVYKIAILTSVEINYSYNNALPSEAEEDGHAHVSTYVCIETTTTKLPAKIKQIPFVSVPHI